MSFMNSGWPIWIRDLYLWAVLTANALEENEGEGQNEADSSEDVPGLATSEAVAQQVAVAGVGVVADEHCRDAVSDLSGKQDDSRISVVKF